jgi:hypothetical protein
MPFSYASSNELHPISELDIGRFELEPFEEFLGKQCTHLNRFHRWVISHFPFVYEVGREF